MAGNPGNVSTENINDVILRLLKLKPGTELDYQTYADILKKRLASARMTGAFLPAEEDTLLREEFRRVKNKKGRFKVKEKTTRVSTPPPSRGPSGGGGGGKMPPRSGSIVKSQKGKITADNYFYQNYVQPVTVKDVTEKTTKVSKKSDPLENINKTLDSILKTLTDINKEDRKARERQRVDAERRQREGKEKGMESRSFEGLKKAISAVTKPFQSIFDRIINFIFYTLLGRAVMKLLDWFGDPKNQGKIQSIVRFFSDHWPTLLALYLRFGTGLGRFIGKLGGVLVKGAFKLGALAAKLLLKAGVGKAGGKLSKVAGFLGGTKGKLLAAGLGIAADVAVTAGTSAAIDKLAGGGGEGTQKFSGGGAVRVPRFAGGGFANFGNMFKGAGFGSMFGPLGMLLGAALGSGKPQEIISGLISGPKGKDKVPAMLTDGEFVMSTGAVQKYGVETLEAMNAAGGGTNQPKIVGGKTYASSGGPIGRRNPDSPYSGSDPVAELRKHFNNFIRSRGAGRNFDIGNPSTWGGGGGGTSASGGGGSGGFLSGLGYLGRAANQVPKIVGPGIGYANRVAGEVNRRVTPTLGYAGRALNEAKKMATPTLNRAGKVVEGVKQKAGSTIDSIKNFDFKGLGALSSSISGAATEALPALLSSTLGISGTDKSISEDMQRQLLQARATAAKRGRNYVDYKDYDGGGLLPGGFTAGGLTMGRIADKEWKRDAQGRIIGLRQIYDTNRSAKEAWNQGMEGLGQFGSSLMKGQLNKEALGRGVYKPFEALLALTQNRGKTMHDVNFSEKVLGFKPGQEVLSSTQKKMIAEQKNREALQNKRPWWDKMGLFGGASAEMKRQRESEAKRAASSGQYGRYAPGSQQVKFSKPKPKPPVKPPVKPKPKVVKVSSTNRGGQRGSGSSPSTQRAPSPSPRHKAGTGTTARTQGTRR